MMQADPTLFDKMNNIRMSGNMMQALQGDESVQQVIFSLMGLNDMISKQAKKEEEKPQQPAVNPAKHEVTEEE